MRDQPNNGFPHSEHLKSRKVINRLFGEGQSLTAFPLRFVWLESEPESLPLRIAVSVPKRRFRKAVDRNRIKRKIRESYRLYKIELWPLLPENRTFSLMLIYIGPDIPESRHLKKAVSQGFRKWLKRVKDDPTRPVAENSIK